jgi:hypothetical protein
MDRKILLEYYLNKYVIPEYILLKRIDVENISEVKDNRIDVDIQIICNYDEFKSKFYLTESLEEMFVYENRISQTFLLAPIFKESKEINFEKIKKDIKHYIKIVVNKRINLFNMNLKLENSHSENNKQSS